jgi:hypothetical protein
VSIRISSLNHFTRGLGFPENLTINDASCPSFTVIFSIFPDNFGGSKLNLKNILINIHNLGYKFAK